MPPVADIIVPAAVMPIVMAVIKVVVSVLPVFADVVAMILPVITAIVGRRETILEIIAPLLWRSRRKLARPLADASRSVTNTTGPIAQSRQHRASRANRSGDRAAARPVSWQLADARPLSNSRPAAGARTCTARAADSRPRRSRQLADSWPPAWSCATCPTDTRTSNPRSGRRKLTDFWS
jgi:hypothetical protein